MHPDDIVTEDGFTAREADKLSRLVQPSLTPATRWPGLPDGILLDYDATDALRYVTVGGRVYRVEATELTVADLNKLARKGGHRLGVNIWPSEMISGTLRNLAPGDRYRCGMAIAALFDTRLDRPAGQPEPPTAA